MSPTTTTSARLARHSAGWRVMRLVSDRAGKNTSESPSQWGRHRFLTPEDRLRRVSSQLAGIIQARQLMRRR